MANSTFSWWLTIALIWLPQYFYKIIDLFRVFFLFCRNAICLFTFQKWFAWFALMFITSVSNLWQPTNSARIAFRKLKPWPFHMWPFHMWPIKPHPFSSSISDTRKHYPMKLKWLRCWVILTLVSVTWTSLKKIDCTQTFKDLSLFRLLNPQNN